MSVAASSGNPGAAACTASAHSSDRSLEGDDTRWCGRGEGERQLVPRLSLDRRLGDEVAVVEHLRHRDRVRHMHRTRRDPRCRTAPELRRVRTAATRRRASCRAKPSPRISTSRDITRRPSPMLQSRRTSRTDGRPAPHRACRPTWSPVRAAAGNATPRSSSPRAGNSRSRRPRVDGRARRHPPRPRARHLRAVRPSAGTARR